MLLIFFFLVMAPTSSYALSLHDALPISPVRHTCEWPGAGPGRSGKWDSGRRDYSQTLQPREDRGEGGLHNQSLGSRCKRDRKSTRLNSSHRCISYAVFCLKKKINTKRTN